MEGDTLLNWLRLQQTPGVGAETAGRLLEKFGDPSSIFRQSVFELEQQVSTQQALALLQEPPTLREQHSLTRHWLAQAVPNAGRAVWTLADLSYPAELRHLNDPPLLVYVQGQLDRRLGPAVAMVGSRNPTPQGAHTAAQFGEALSVAGLCVVSGLALGIDAAAHRGALRGAAARSAAPHWATVAVVGTGLDRVYPRQHQSLAQAIAENGLLMSEYPLGTPPLAANFPKRNRLIAALGQGTLVVEAALRSGSLITAHQALELGREVMAVPGSIHAPQSHGCHALIRQGARLVENARDVLEELRLTGMPSAPPASDADEKSGEEAQRVNALGQGDTGLPDDPILQALGFDPTPLDSLKARCGLDTATLQAQLLSLELAGQVARMPGGLYQRVVSP